MPNCVATKQGYDIYGLKIDNHDANGELVECAICKKTVAASRFAPHLEKCMGLGRTARIKRNTTTSSGTTANANSGSGTKKARASTGPSSTSDLDEQLSVNNADTLSEQSSQPSSNNSKLTLITVFLLFINNLSNDNNCRKEKTTDSK